MQNRAQLICRVSHALNGPFGIYFFVGESNDEVKTRPEEFLIAPTLAGLTYNFAAQIEACANCAQHKQDELEITSTTVITQILRDYKKGKKLDSLKPDHVIPFLKQRLAWRIVLVSFSAHKNYNYAIKALV